MVVPGFGSSPGIRDIVWQDQRLSASPSGRIYCVVLVPGRGQTTSTLFRKIAKGIGNIKTD